MAASRSLTNTLYHLWSLERVAYSIRVFIALTGVMAVCWWRDELSLLVPLFLGIIASALAETDDNWQGRLKAVVVTLVCFSITSASVTVLFPYPWLFAVGLAASAFFLTLLGAIGSRYSTIGMATLILSIYTMISVSQHIEMNNPHIWRDSIALIVGAAWYGLLSVVWSFLFAHQPVLYALASLFYELGEYLKIKTTLIEPVRRLDLEERRLALAKQNGKVVAALNSAKETILNRMKGSRHNPQVSRYLKLYFIAQDIHERASSSHYPYDALSEAFFHSDVLFRCQLLLHHQGRACQLLAKAIRLKEPFVYSESTEALEDLKKSIDYVKQQPETNRRLLRSVRALAQNLTVLEQKLVDAKNPDALTHQDISLFDREVHTVKEAFIRLKQNFSFTSLTFRHAVRIAIALSVGYGLMHLLNAEYGFWILLTTLFVCRPSYGATRVRLVQRMIGTVIGVVSGWALITLFPSLIVESIITIIAGVLFFAYRVSRYTLSTAFITLMILCCFNQMGSSAFTMIMPRLLDTFIGCTIAGLAVFLILPDWQGRQLNRVLANTLSTSSRYLREIMRQYETGKEDDLDYRVARRNAHNADAALSSALASMLLEPGYFRKDADAGFRFLVVSHTLLSYLSALGAHRETLQDDSEIDTLLDRVTTTIADDLDEIANDLLLKKPVKLKTETEESLAKELEQLPDEMDDNLKLVLTELALICRQLIRIRTLAAQLQHQAIEQPVAN
ncbi:YccS family putative transporter [Entomomonas asaccharolytica]|uniref:TIGR01666 family membrane protein n=1 Tax=Entomomonas asaccharolytica TaxID=2785331 RepID=A0A974RW76_9GAMM|nr:YccS family putative transporter [Entomomonas asaccharolytica]QQP84936.1 TIGR01666 family membrane protein [Entomomonas asaccharolytica]